MSQLHKRKREVRQAEEQRATKRDLNLALEEIEDLKLQLQAVKRLQRKTKALEIKPRKGHSSSEAVAIVCASDWHIGQTVTAGATNGLNEFNPRVAQVRVKRFFERLVRLTNKERQDIEISELVLFLGGDFIEGSLHLDTIMGAEPAGAMNQVVLAQSYIEGGLNYIKEHGNFKRVTVVCSDGNHGRVSTKQHHHSRRGNALEYYLYHNLAGRFPEFEWVINESMLTYLPIYGSVIRFMHGDRISFGGVNGFYTYLHRRIFEWDMSIKADYTILGHLHQYTPGLRYLVNGSLVGYNSFAQALSARYQPPIQSFMLWDKKRGPTVHIPILL